ncbi:MAG TPA: hypothetical protein VG708_12395 [Mycobacteriales bacterium]|nr:hypothetical protein [Mycobacteriales bacterium]
MIRRLATVVALVAVMVPAWTAGSGAASSTRLGRQSEFSGIGAAGGNYFIRAQHRASRTGDLCTMGFAVRSATTGRVGLLTAGHCARNLAGSAPYVVHQTRGGRSGTTYVGESLGTVGAHATVFGKRGDSGFIKVLANRRAVARVFVGGVATKHARAVVGRARPHNHMRVCYSGAASGEHCGFRVVHGSRTIGFPFHHHIRRIHHEWTATRKHCPAEPGDSGAPVYTKHHGRIHAVGILTGGQQVSGKCPLYFSPLPLALHRLHLRLMVK